MAKGKTKNVDVTVEAGKSTAKVKKTGKKVEVVVDTPNVDVTYKQDEDSKEFNLDGQNLDIKVTKEDGKLDIDVKSNGKIGSFFGKFIPRNFKMR